MLDNTFKTTLHIIRTRCLCQFLSFVLSVYKCACILALCLSSSLVVVTSLISAKTNCFQVTDQISSIRGKLRYGTPSTNE